MHHPTDRIAHTTAFVTPVVRNHTVYSGEKYVIYFDAYYYYKKNVEFIVK